MRASEGTNPCTRPSFATKNVFGVLQDLSESIRGSPGPQLDAADGQPEPIVQDLHQSLIELLEQPEILSLHAVRRVGRERQLHLKVRALCGEVEKVFDVLVDTELRSAWSRLAYFRQSASPTVGSLSRWRWRTATTWWEA